MSLRIMDPTLEDTLTQEHPTVNWGDSHWHTHCVFSGTACTRRGWSALGSVPLSLGAAGDFSSTALGSHNLPINVNTGDKNHLPSAKLRDVPKSCLKSLQSKIMAPKGRDHLRSGSWVGGGDRGHRTLGADPEQLWWRPKPSLHERRELLSHILRSEIPRPSNGGGPRGSRFPMQCPPHPPAPIWLSAQPLVSLGFSCSS